jgi:transposase
MVVFEVIHLQQGKGKSVGEVTANGAERAIVRVGVDLAKRVIQVHAVDARGKPVVRRALAREKFLAWCAQLPPGCLVVMEVSSSAHHWARKLLTMGLDARIVAAHLAAPYRAQGATGKNDANDAAAICEAGGRPSMRFVPVKSVEQQSMLSVHRLREGFKADRTACINRIRGLLLEFGVAVPTGSAALRASLHDILEDAGNELNGLARMTLQRAQMQWLETDEHLAWCDQRIVEHHAANAQVRHAAQMLGVGPVGASAAIATVGDFKQFDCGAQFGAWLGLTPKQRSSGGKARLGTITKRGDPYLRTLLVQGAKSVVHSATKRDDPISRWVLALKERRGWQTAVVALANKNARILWAIMTRGESYNPRHLSRKPDAALGPDAAVAAAQA